MELCARVVLEGLDVEPVLLDLTEDCLEGGERGIGRFVGLHNGIRLSTGQFLDDQNGNVLRPAVKEHQVGGVLVRFPNDRYVKRARVLASEALRGLLVAQNKVGLLEGHIHALPPCGVAHDTRIGRGAHQCAVVHLAQTLH